MTVAFVVLTAALALGLQMPQQQPPAKPAPPSAAQDAPKVVMFTGCVIAAPDREDSFHLVQSVPDPAKPVGTTGSPAVVWTVPAFLLLGGQVSAEHLSRTVEISGTIDAAPAPEAAAVAQPDPKKPGDTTSRTQQTAPAIGQLHVQSVKVIAQNCTPKQKDQQSRDK
jgi:hypothetical protein